MSILTPYQTRLARDSFALLLTMKIQDRPAADFRCEVVYSVLCQRGGVTAPYNDELRLLLEQLDVEVGLNPKRDPGIQLAEYRQNLSDSWVRAKRDVRAAYTRLTTALRAIRAHLSHGTGVR
jgi:hypothetical protein